MINISRLNNVSGAKILGIVNGELLTLEEVDIPILVDSSLNKVAYNYIKKLDLSKASYIKLFDEKERIIDINDFFKPITEFCSYEYEFVVEYFKLNKDKK